MTYDIRRRSHSGGGGGVGVGKASVGRRRSRSASHSAKTSPDSDEYPPIAREPLILPPTKLQKKRERLMRLYEKMKRRKEEDELAAEASAAAEAKAKIEAALAGPAGVLPADLDAAAGAAAGLSRQERQIKQAAQGVKNEYEKNRANNMQSHISMPTYSTLSSRSRSSGASSGNYIASCFPKLCPFSK